MTDSDNKPDVPPGFDKNVSIHALADLYRDVAAAKERGLKKGEIKALQTRAEGVFQGFVNEAMAHGGDEDYLHMLQRWKRRVFENISA